MAVIQPLTDDQWKLFYIQCNAQMNISLETLIRLKGVIQFELLDMIISDDGVVTKEARQKISDIITWATTKEKGL